MQWQKNERSCTYVIFAFIGGELLLYTVSVHSYINADCNYINLLHVSIVGSASNKPNSMIKLDMSIRFSLASGRSIHGP